MLSRISLLIVLILIGFQFSKEEDIKMIMKLYKHTANIKAGLFILGVSFSDWVTSLHSKISQ